jgi:hypothetical protein
MIEAKELRIGNLVNFKVNKTPNKVESINFAGVCTLDRIGVVLTDGLVPIPLTEEWLIKFGFEKEEDYYVYILGYDFGEIKIYPSPNGFFFIEGVIQEHIKHVHKLQNLCFVFGEELTIKE